MKIDIGGAQIASKDEFPKKMNLFCVIFVFYVDTFVTFVLIRTESKKGNSGI